MAVSTEAKKVLLSAVTHLSGKARLARFHSVSTERLARAEADVATGLAELGPLLDSTAATIAEERKAFLAKAEEQRVLAEHASARGATVYAAHVAAQEEAFRRKATIRDPEDADYDALLQRRWRATAAMRPSLKHLPRGHRVSVHVKYPHFKRAAEALLVEMGGCADKGRQSVSIFVGKSNWAALQRYLGDEAKMGEHGGVIPLSISALKRHKRRSARSRQPKCTDEAGQLNVSSRKVAKLLLPTAVEQPNGHQMNLLVKELERFGLLNADLFDIGNRDDKANFQLDNVYRKKRLLQELLQRHGKRGTYGSHGTYGFKDEDGKFDKEAYDRSMKAETHDMITASGYRLIATTTAQMDLGLSARARATAEEAPSPIEWDTSKQLERDAKLMVT
eukprot:7118658-Prymnesium_polylepis.1